MLIDLIVILFIAISAVLGYKKGLVGILVSFIGFILAIILAFTLQSTLVDYLKNTPISTGINDSIKQNITSTLNTKSEDSQKQFYLNVISKFGTTDKIDELCNNITTFILKIISFIGIFIIVILISFMLQMLLNLVFKLPILSSVNKVGGIFASCIMSIFKIWILLAIISFLSTMNIANGALEYINKTTITKNLYNNNVIVSILSSNLIKK
ncbi:MAG: CvpA family protein [Clostridia bacterium]|nr:CvpA family protein [Clostridia bacterium]